MAHQQIAQLQYEVARLEAENARLKGENAALRELMNCYNVGGWTDSLTLINERDKLREELERERVKVREHSFKIQSESPHRKIFEAAKEAIEQEQMK